MRRSQAGALQSVGFAPRRVLLGCTLPLPLGTGDGVRVGQQHLQEVAAVPLVKLSGKGTCDRGCAQSAAAVRLQVGG